MEQLKIEKFSKYLVCLRTWLQWNVCVIAHLNHSGSTPYLQDNDHIFALVSPTVNHSVTKVYLLPTFVQARQFTELWELAWVQSKITWITADVAILFVSHTSGFWVDPWTNPILSQDDYIPRFEGLCLTKCKQMACSKEWTPGSLLWLSLWTNSYVAKSLQNTYFSLIHNKWGKILSIDWFKSSSHVVQPTSAYASTRIEKKRKCWSWCSLLSNTKEIIGSNIRLYFMKNLIMTKETSQTGNWKNIENPNC